MTESLAPAPPMAGPSVSVPGVPSILRAVGGLLVFGACVGLGAPAMQAFSATALTPAAGLVGAAVLTGPALVAGHVFLRPDVRVEVPVAALGQGLEAAGSLAAGLAPFALFLVATSGLWPMVLLAGFAVTGLACGGVTLRTLLQAAPGHTGFVVGWLLFAALVALRIAFAVGVSGLEAVR